MPSVYDIPGGSNTGLPDGALLNSAASFHLNFPNLTPHRPMPQVCRRLEISVQRHAANADQVTHGLRCIFNAARRAQPSVRSQRVVVALVTAGLAADLLRVPGAYALQQANAALVRNAPRNIGMLQGGGDARQRQGVTCTSNCRPGR